MTPPFCNSVFYWEITVVIWEDKSYPNNKMTFLETIVLLVDIAAVYN